MADGKPDLSGLWLNELGSFALPPLPAPQHWRRIIDTARPSPDDIAEAGREARLTTAHYRVEARAIVVLKAGP